MSGAASINQKDIDEYRKVYKEKYGKDISNFEAREQLSKLVRMLEIVYQPITKEELKAFNSNKNKTNI